MDNIELELFGCTLGAIVDEMEAGLTRTAYSRLIHDYKDYCVGLVDARFRLIAQSRGGIPLFVGDLAAPVRDAVEIAGPDGLAPDSVLISNYAGISGQHLNNVVMLQPVFCDGEVFGYFAIRAHWIDIGGLSPGSISWHATEIYHEGIQYRGLEVVRGGRVVPGALATILANTRLPGMVRGDFFAQLGMVNLGVRRWQERVAARWSGGQIRELIDRQIATSEQIARQRIAELPPGRYEAACTMDDSGLPGSDPLELRLAVVVGEDGITIDLTDMPDQVVAPVNAGSLGGGLSVVRVAYKALLAPDERTDEGLFAPLTVRFREGSVFSAGPEAAMGHWNSNMATLIDLVFRAVGQVRPELAPAGHHGSMGMCTFFGTRGDGTRWEYGDTAMGGFGGSVRGDGHTALKTLGHGDTPAVPVEVAEGKFPVRFESFELVPDSAGDGQFRGGWGTQKVLTVLEPAVLNTSLDRTSTPPWGLNGGEPGLPGAIELREPGGREWISLKKVTGRPVAAGSQVRIRAAGGGGWGRRADRPAALLRQDVEAGLRQDFEAGPRQDFETGPRAGDEDGNG